jgi:hypothetical protein
MLHTSCSVNFISAISFPKNCLCFLFGARGGGGSGIHMYVTRLRAGRSGVESREGYRFILLTSRPALGLDDRVFFALHGSSPGVEAVGRWNWLSSSNPEVKNEWILTSTPPRCLHGLDRNDFTFVFTFTWVHGWLRHSATRSRFRDPMLHCISNPVSRQ